MDQEFILWKYIVYNFFRFCIVAACFSIYSFRLLFDIFFDYPDQLFFFISKILLIDFVFSGNRY
jgi:hypothetical protein